MDGDKFTNILVIIALILFGACVVVFVVEDVVLDHDIPSIQNQTEFVKIGYVTEIEFIGGGGGFDAQSKKTIIRFYDGDVVTLRYWKTEIPKQQNVTLHYHDNGYGRYFLDWFTVLKEGGK